MIYESWYGIFDKKSNLLAVEESKHCAQSVALNLELDPPHPTNRILQVTILACDLSDLTMAMLEEAKRRIHARDATHREAPASKEEPDASDV